MIGVSDPGNSSLDLLLGQVLPVPDLKRGVKVYQSQRPANSPTIRARYLSDQLPRA
jgi:hypothetical protein